MINVALFRYTTFRQAGREPGPRSEEKRGPGAPRKVPGGILKSENNKELDPESGPGAICVRSDFCLVYR